jgi:hypothetical protein
MLNHYTTQQFQAVRTGIEPVASDRQSEMLAFTPTNQWAAPEIRTQSSWLEVRYATINACTAFSIGDRIRTCSLPAPDGVSDQPEYSYLL